MRARRVGRPGRSLGLVFGARNDVGAVSGTGRQDAMISYQVEPWWGYEGGQFLEQFVGREHEMGGAV